MIRYNFERVGIRLIRESAAEPSKPVRCPDDAVSVAAEHLADYDREAMIVINMDGAGRPINYTVAGIGCGTMLPLSGIYEKISLHEKAKKTNHPKEKVRQTLGLYPQLFRKDGRGYWDTVKA